MKANNNVITMDPKVYNKIISKLMAHRTMVEGAMAVVAQDLMTRGRVHDNSISDDTEMILNYQALIAEDKDKQEDYQDMAEHLHKSNNDHHPEHFESGLCDMSLVQLLEFVIDQMVIIETTTDDELCSGEDYIKHMPELLDHKELRPIIIATIDHIKRLMNQRTQWVNTLKEEMVKDATIKEPTIQSI